jgi:hypothetical protein
VEEAAAAARALGVELQIVEARDPKDFDQVFSDVSGARAGALAVLATPVFDNVRRRLLELGKV